MTDLNETQVERRAARRAQLPDLTIALDYILQSGVSPRPDCLLWFGDLRPGGYGRVVVNGERHGVHRLVHELAIGPIPDGYEVDHLCRVRNCINPEHLEAVTPEENRRRIPPRRRGALRLRAAPALRCSNGHEYSPENTQVDSNGHRRCRTCLRAKWRKQTERRRAQRTSK